jgi:carboxymethylenebutenolidase
MRITLASGTPAISVPRPGAHAGLVIAADIWGLRQLYDDLADRLAEQWDVAVCVPEPFPGRDLPAELAPRAAAIAATDDAERLVDLEMAARATGCDRVGLIGFCMGGMYGLKAAASGAFARIVACYGMIRLPADWIGPGQREPLTMVAAGTPERVLAILGDRDPYTPPADIAALEALGVSTLRFPEAGHGFVHDPSREAHRSADAAVAWEAARAWLDSID